MIIIDHEMFGVASEFDSLEEAQRCIRLCGDGFRDVELKIGHDGIVYEKNTPDTPVGYKKA